MDAHSNLNNSASNLSESSRNNQVSIVYDKPNEIVALSINSNNSFKFIVRPTAVVFWLNSKLKINYIHM